MNDVQRIGREEFDVRAGTAGDLSTAVVRYLNDLFADSEAILDVGCGRGHFSRDGVVGLDRDLAALRVAHGNVVQGDLRSNLPFRGAAFDGILAKDVIEHLEDPRPAVLEMARVCRPGGVLVVFTPRAIPRAVWADYTHVRGFTRRAVESLLGNSGWQVLAVRRFGAVPLAGRLGLVRHIPAFLRIPGVGHYFGTNWQVIARRT